VITTSLSVISQSVEPPPFAGIDLNRVTDLMLSPREDIFINSGLDLSACRVIVTSIVPARLIAVTNFKVPIDINSRADTRSFRIGNKSHNKG
jgi:hypothetical protein